MFDLLDESKADIHDLQVRKTKKNIVGWQIPTLNPPHVSLENFVRKVTRTWQLNDELFPQVLEVPSLRRQDNSAITFFAKRGEEYN